ncbi:Lrp/AsnC family transcriptional regulator [Halobacteriales archaeon Cl-PHB]
MRDLDDTDIEILSLLMNDARRPWADIADAVGLSPPAVSDRVDRLQETGLIRRFTLDVDRSQLRGGVPVLVTLTVGSTAFEAVHQTARTVEGVEHVYVTAERDLVCYVQVPDGDVPSWIAGTFDEAAVDDYSVTLLTEAEWTPDVGGADFALDCAECDNTVTSEGVASRIGGELKQFCCPSCESRYREQYERLEEGA